jgi:hypothetical protein
MSIFNPLVGVNQLTCKDVLETSIMQMKGQCFVVANMPMNELDWCFLDFEMTNFFSIVYAQFWM